MNSFPQIFPMQPATPVCEPSNQNPQFGEHPEKTREVFCGGKRFLLLNGMRVWTVDPPQEIVNDLHNGLFTS